MEIRYVFRHGLIQELLHALIITLGHKLSFSLPLDSGMSIVMGMQFSADIDSADMGIDFGTVFFMDPDMELCVVLDSDVGSGASVELDIDLGLDSKLLSGSPTDPDMDLDLDSCPPTEPDLNFNTLGSGAVMGSGLGSGACTDFNLVLDIDMKFDEHVGKGGLCVWPVAVTVECTC